MDSNQNQKPGVYYGQGSYGQPQQQAQTSDVKVIIQQPQQETYKNKLLVGSIKGEREWSSGMFECFTDIGNCLLTMFCYSCSICQLASRTGECLCTPMFVPATDVSLRTRIRTLGGIRGSMCQDCIIVTCCPMCSACQESRELTQMGIP